MRKASPFLMRKNTLFEELPQKLGKRVLAGMRLEIVKILPYIVRRLKNLLVGVLVGVVILKL